jgi:hypothetical protein
MDLKDPHSVKFRIHFLISVLYSSFLYYKPGMQCNCMMGLFPEIERAFLTIDRDIFVWKYEDG